jgi:hypothetical protein
MSTAEQIHSYDVEPRVPDKGWVHYTSRVPGWEGVDARVADVVRSLEDVSSQTVGFIPDRVPPGLPSPRTRLLLAKEAVRVSLFAPTWLDRIMTRSPLRDHDLWRREEKARYLEQRRQRRKNFTEGTLVFAEPNKLAASPEGGHEPAPVDPSTKGGERKLSEVVAVVGWKGRAAWASSPAEIEAMVKTAVAGLAGPLKKPKPASIQGAPRRCWQTVARAAKKEGGKLLRGWSVVEAEPRLPQTNPFARIVLNAHCVLEKDGEWYETIPERYTALGFIPGPVPSRDASIEFFDDAASLEGADLPALGFNGLPFSYHAQVIGVPDPANESMRQEN